MKNSSSDWTPFTKSLGRGPTTETSASVRFLVSSELSHFAGHFPGNPVLPAVAILEFSLHVARELNLFPPALLQKIAQAKFLAPIRPGSEINIEFAATENVPTKLKVIWQMWVAADQTWVSAAEFVVFAESSATS